MHSSSYHPAKLEKLSHSNCLHEAFNPVTRCHPLHCSPSRRAPAPVPSAGQAILQSPRGVCFRSCLCSHMVPKVIQRFGEEHHLATMKLLRLFQETKEFKELQESLQGPLLDKWPEQQALLIYECERTRSVWKKYTALSGVCLPKTHYGDHEDDHQWDQTVSRELQRLQ